MNGRVTGSGRNGEIAVQSPSQKIIIRSGIKINNDSMTVILFAGLPGNGRSVLAQECIRLFSELLPYVWEECLSADSLDLKEIQNSIKALEDYFALTRALDKNGWVAFVADGSHLPRESGVSDLSLKKTVSHFFLPMDYGQKQTSLTKAK